MISLFVGDDGKEFKINDCVCGHGKVRIVHDQHRYRIGILRDGFIQGSATYKDGGRSGYAFSCTGCKKDLDFKTVKKRHVENLNRLEVA